MKRCGGCGDAKELDEFYRDQSRTDGHRPVCKACDGAYGQSARAERAREQSRSRLAGRKTLVETTLGVKCLFCGYRDRLTSHRKDGQSHKPFNSMGQAEFRQHVESGEYVRVCYRCHKSVHWAMECLGLDWERISGLALDASDPCKI